MATGPDHYHRAETLITGFGAVDTPGTDETRDVLALAQVHATLALAAATALRNERLEHLEGSDSDWNGVAGINAKTDEEPHYRHKSLPRWQDRSGTCVKCGADAGDGSCTVPDEPESSAQS